MATLRTPKAWPRHTARWFCERVQAQLVPGISHEGEHGRSRAAGAGFVLTVLIGLTTLAVAWVCVWWVPAYLALMVCIFVIPYGHGAPEHVSVADEGSTVGNWVDPGQGLRIDHVSEVVCHHLASGSILGLATSESGIETGVAHLGSASSGATKVRRTRGRTRKAVQTAAGNAPASAATWIRVGPGKFVRAEGGSQTVDQTKDGVDSVSDHKVSYNSTPDSPASLPVDDAPVGGDSSPEVPVVNADDQERSGGSNDRVMGSVIEVYGIAPSTFDSIRSDSPPVENPRVDVTLADVILDANCSSAPDFGSDLSVHDRQMANSGGKISGSRLYRSSRLIVNTIRRRDRASLRCTVRKGPEGRSSLRFFARPDGRLQQAFRRTFGPVSHVQRRAAPSFATFFLRI